MSTKRLTPAMIARTTHIIDNSGVLDIIAPPPAPGSPGRKGAILPNIRLWAIGVILCARLGHETTVRGVYDVLTQALPREEQWELGVLRPLTTRNATQQRTCKPEEAHTTKNGKPRKEVWAEEGYERISYDDLVNATERIRKTLDYGPGSAPGLDEEARAHRRGLVEAAIDRLIAITVIPRTGTTCAIDATVTALI